MADVVYQRVSTPEYAATILATFAMDGHVYRGKCPRCGDDAFAEIRSEGGWGVLSRTTFGPKPDKQSILVVVECNCPNVHETRPPGVDSGCGLYATVEFE